MGKRKTQVKEPVQQELPLEDYLYKSSLCGLANGASQANKFNEEGYDVVYCFPVIATDATKEPPVNVQGIYILAKRRN